MAGFQVARELGVASSADLLGFVLEQPPWDNRKFFGKDVGVWNACGVGRCVWKDEWNGMGWWGAALAFLPWQTSAWGREEE